MGITLIPRSIFMTDALTLSTSLTASKALVAQRKKKLITFVLVRVQQKGHCKILVYSTQYYLNRKYHSKLIDLVVMGLPGWQKVTQLIEGPSKAISAGDE
jgi:hypothetical protein